jgi:hypothetical protein
MSSIIVGALMALSMVQQTDTVVPLEGATRLSVDTPGGSITVEGWDRDEIRVQAEHSMRTFVDIDRSGTTVKLESDAERGPAGIVDFKLTVPRDLDLALDGMYTDIAVEGVVGEVEAENLQGDITVRGGRGRVKLGSVSGRILVEGAEGSVEVESAAGDVRILDSAGEIYGVSGGGEKFM